MYHSVFVPLDGSEFSARALPVAAALARRTGAALHLVVVFDPSTFLRLAPGDAATSGYDQGAVAKFCGDTRAWVEEQAASLANTGLSARGELLEGTVVEALAERAAAVQADIVVMTTHGRSGLDRLWLGSIAGSFLSRSPAPVLLVRPSGPEAPTAGHELPTGTLLVPLDGSPFSETVLPRATAFATALSLAIELVMVVVPMSTPLSIFGTDVVSPDDTITQGQEARARTYLAKVAATLTPAPAIKVLADVLPARALIEYATRTNPGAFAMATHARSGIARMVAGSVADKLLHGAKQPLLVFRPPDAPISQ